MPSEGVEIRPETVLGDDPRSDTALPLSVIREIDAVCRRFEESWKSGEPDAIVPLLEVEGKHRSALLRELLAIELEYRVRRGDRPLPEEYLARFPQQSDVIGFVFHEATEAPSPIPAAAEISSPPALKDHPRYRVLKLLGNGGMGAVFLAEHRLMQRQVALKVIRPELVRDSDLADRFLSEVKAAGTLNHPNIVVAHDAETTPDCSFLVMEYVRGSNLAEEIAQRGPLPWQTACNYIAQAARGLQHAHERGMVHRDIKPHNLMLCPDGQIKILDFGLAQFRSEAMPDDKATIAGSIVGSADYMAPEQAINPQATDIRADIYSLGCTWYFLVTGRPLFASGPIHQRLRAHAEQPPELSKLSGDIPQEVIAAITKMLAKRPDARYATPGEVASVLTARTSWSLPEKKSPPPETSRQSRLLKSLLKPGRRPFAVAAVLIGLLAVGSVNTSNSARTPRRGIFAAQPVHRSDADPVHNDPKAVEQYQKGMRKLEQRQERTVASAVACFSEAIKLAPNSALAHAGLASAYNMQGYNGWVAALKVFPPAEEAALNALKLNGRSAEAHLAIAVKLNYYDLDWRQAEQEYQQSLDINAESASTHEWYAWYLVQQRRFDEAERHIRRAHHLASGDMTITSNVGKVEYFARSYTVAVEKFRQALELEPDFRKAHCDLGLTFVELGKYSEALRELSQGRGPTAGGHEVLAAEAYVSARKGRVNDAKQILAELEPLADRHVVSYEIATVYAALGDKDAAYLWLDRAFEERSPQRTYIKVDPKLDRLREDNRFKKLLKRAGFEE